MANIEHPYRGVFVFVRYFANNVRHVRCSLRMFACQRAKLPSRQRQDVVRSELPRLPRCYPVGLKDVSCSVSNLLSSAEASPDGSTSETDQIGGVSPSYPLARRPWYRSEVLQVARSGRRLAQ
jgi:hypothetical protein